jgi:hypothetical protein
MMKGKDDVEIQISSRTKVWSSREETSFGKRSRLLFIFFSSSSSSFSSSSPPPP